MLWLTKQERLTLAVLGTLALIALGILMWQRLHPPLSVEGQPTTLQAAQWDTALKTARQVDVNAADAAELERLPGVGPLLAARVVDYRTAHGRFRSADELMQVPGIGPKTYEALRDHVATQ